VIDEQFGSYRIVGKLGEGGMGQVYRATDTRLKRQVAIKILPASVAADADRLARFRREAEVLASLNHPNIAAIYGIEESGETPALAMELVEGDDLSQRIAARAIPLDEVLLIAKQIADALEAAHEQGIVHRDLKPANVKVRADGVVKVLDFGLAKAVEPAAGAGVSSYELSRSPTITTPAMTLQGVILGTAAYMAPEQAKGRAADKRADIWAFGVVLYEMLTGRRLFEAEDISETLAAVLTRDVSMTTLPDAIPPRLRTLLRDCLVRDPRQRLRDIGDARIVLEQIIAGGPQAEPASAVAAVVPAWRRTVPWAVAAVALIVAGVAQWAQWATSRVEKPSDRSLMRLDVDLGDDVSLPASGGASEIAISPDGTRLAYASGTPTRLFIRRLDQAKATELPGTQGATQPSFSRDGQWVGFVSGRRVSKISVEGGAAVPLGDFAGVRGASWGEDGSIVISSQKLLRIPASGGPPETVAEPRSDELGLTGPQLLPGGKAILFAADNPGPVDKTTIDVITLADGQRKTLVRGGASPRYLATTSGDGHLVYVNGSTLFAIPFDLKTLSTHGTAVAVVDDVAHDILVGAGQFDVSDTATLVYRRAIGSSTLLMLQWLDPSGKRQPMGAKAGFYRDVSVSPDGSRLALTLFEGAGQDVWVYETRRDALTRLTFDGTSARYPRWSPDGRYVVFAAVGKGIFQVRADGGSQPQALTLSKAIQYPSSFSPDGKWLAFEEATQTHILPIQDRDGVLKAGAPEPFLKNSTVAPQHPWAGGDRSPSFSPDGRWLAYESEQSGLREVYVRAFQPTSSGSDGQWLISNNGGMFPRWSGSGHDLLYQSGDQIMAVGYTASGDKFVAEKPRVWIAKLGGLATLWDLTPDGKRVAVVTPAGDAQAPMQEHAVVFLQNFFDELRRRVPLNR
jgi:Tol biopolymer transport system component/tRNA A-37 threonylcarbamoyl transferase component Bud32